MELGAGPSSRGASLGSVALLWIWVLWRQFSAGFLCQRDVPGLSGSPGSPHAPQGLGCAEAAPVQGSAVPRHSPESWATEVSTGAAQAAQAARGAPSSGPAVPGPAVLQGKVLEPRWVPRGQGRDAGALRGFRCWQGSPGCVPLPAGWQEVPRRGEVRSWLGNVGVCGQGGPGPAPAAGGLFLLAASSGSRASRSRPGSRTPRETVQAGHLVGVPASHLAPP